MVLESKPAANVQVAIASTATGEAVVVASSLLFTAGNWSVPQAVLVEGVDDPVIDGTQSFTIQVGPATSSDPNYAALANQFAGGDNADDDVAGIAVTPVAGLQVAEGGTTAQFNVVLNTQPGTGCRHRIASGDTAEVTVSDALLTFTSGDWNVPQAVTLTGVDDAVVDGSQSVTITLAAAVSADGDYSGLNPDDVAVDNADDDAAGILVTPVAGLETTEGLGTAQFTVVLTSQPASQVTVALQVSDATEGELLSAGSLDFGTGDWDQPQTVTVRGKNDDTADGDIPYEVEVQAASSADPEYSGVDPDDVGLTNLDDDSAISWFRRRARRFSPSRYPPRLSPSGLGFGTGGGRQHRTLLLGPVRVPAVGRHGLAHHGQLVHRGDGYRRCRRRSGGRRNAALHDPHGGGGVARRRLRRCESKRCRPYRRRQRSGGRHGHSDFTARNAPNRAASLRSRSCSPANRRPRWW